MIQTRIKMFLFILLAAFFWLPLFQELTRYFKEPELHGAFVKPGKPKISIATLKSLVFQKQFEEYENNYFGFRGLLIKIKNSVDYILFKELSIEDNIAGKDDFIFSRGSTERMIGLLYNGKEKNEITIEKINFLKEGLEKRGHHLLSIIAPSKEIVIPDFLPLPYRDHFKYPNDYSDFIEGYKKYNIPFIDFCPYFKKLVAASPYPIYTKTGFHWSMYGASLAQDSLLHYIENISSKPLPGYLRNGIEWSDTSRGSDNDFETPLNLLFSLGQSRYAYPILQMDPSTLNNYRPKVIIIGDSFFWQIKNQKNLKDIFSEESKFWYYFAVTSFPMGDAAGVPLKDMDAIKELESADYVILFGSIGTLDRFPFGVTDYYYDHVSKPAIVKSIQENIKNNSSRMTEIFNMSVAKNISVEKLLLEEAMRVGRDKEVFHLRAANNKYVCADGARNHLVIADRNGASTWETFSLLHLDNSKCAVYSYEDKFLSAELNDKTEISATRSNIEEWETFTMTKLDSGFVAFKAANGKYLSMDEKSLRLFARGNAIGKLEKFKLIMQ